MGKTKEVLLRLPMEMADAIDTERGDVPRTKWIFRAIEERLQNKKRRGQEE